MGPGTHFLRVLKRKKQHAMRVVRVRLAGLASDDAETILHILRDHRGWAAQGVDFVRDDNNAEVRVEMRTPAQLRSEFGSAFGDLSLCSSDGFIYLNTRNWARPPANFGDTMDNENKLRTYREYVVQHEMGHWLGLWTHEDPVHVSFACPVMYQQTKGTKGHCRPNPWATVDPTRPVLEGGGGELERIFMDAAEAPAPEQGFVARMLDATPFGAEEDAVDAPGHAELERSLRRNTNADLRRALHRVMRLMVHYRHNQEKAEAAKEATEADEVTETGEVTEGMRRMKALLAASERDLGMALAELQRRQQGSDVKAVEKKIVSMIEHATSTVRKATARIAQDIATDIQGGGGHEALMTFS